MDTRRSFYLASKQDDFAEPPADASRLDFDDIPLVTAGERQLSGLKIVCRHANLPLNILR